jgi:hypothetical protein
MKMVVFWAVGLVDRYKYTRFSEVCTASMSFIALMMEAVQTSETSVNLCQSTRRCNPEHRHLCTHRHDKFKSKDLNMPEHLKKT